MSVSLWEAVAALPLANKIFFAVALTVALGFEFVNGFHDTANAVTTVIYTRTLKPTAAVLYSGVLNFLGCCWAGRRLRSASSTSCPSTFSSTAHRCAPS